jgi:ATP-dependent exoDNAse (exonuclease V) beta subunit
LHWVVGDVAPADLDRARDAEYRQQTNERQRMWYVACTRARDLLVVPRLPGARSNSWFRVVRLDQGEIATLDTGALPPRLVRDAIGATNEQTLQAFTEQAAAVAASAPAIRWSQPSARDEDSLEPMDVTTVSDLAAVRARPTGAGPLRGTAIHRLLEEAIGDDLQPRKELVRERAQQLLAQLTARSPAEDTSMPDPDEVAATVVSVLALPDLAALLPHLQPEVAVWHADSEHELLAGRADAVVVADDEIVGVLDWKSDAAPSPEKSSRYTRQISDYVRATGALAGAIVYVTTGDVLWVGDRAGLLERLANIH